MQMGWKGLENGALLVRTAAQFDALIRMDKNTPVGFVPHDQVKGHGRSSSESGDPRRESQLLRQLDASRSSCRQEDGLDGVQFGYLAPHGLHGRLAAPPLTPDAPPLRGVRLDRVVFHYTPRKTGREEGEGRAPPQGGSQKRPFLPPIPSWNRWGT